MDDLRSTMPHGYFRSMYDRAPDPWGFDARWYERRKFDITLACLPRPRFRRALEAGCSNGSLTELLAPRCDELVAFDFVADAVERCRRRCDGLDRVAVVHASFPEFWPSGRGDLVVWSEIAYYVAGLSADRALAGLERWLEPGGTVVAVHYTGETNYPRPGSAIVPWLDDVDFLRRQCHVVDDEFELGVWSREGHLD
jgi:SAM-dependent methyltransferase